MEKRSYFVTLTRDNSLDIQECNNIPDFVHAVKFDHENNLEVYLSADVSWTPELEHLAMQQVHQMASDLIYHL